MGGQGFAATPSATPEHLSSNMRFMHFRMSSTAESGVFPFGCMLQMAVVKEWSISGVQR